MSNWQPANRAVFLWNFVPVGCRHTSNLEKMDKLLGFRSSIFLANKLVYQDGTSSTYLLRISSLINFVFAQIAVVNQISTSHFKSFQILLLRTLKLFSRHYRAVHWERFWNMFRKTRASVRSPNKLFLLNNSVIKWMQKIRFENIENRRPCGSLTYSGEKYPAKPANSAFQKSLKIIPFSWLIHEYYFSVRVKWSESRIKHSEKESTALQHIFEKTKTTKIIFSST